MREREGGVRAMSMVLRPAFGICLLLAQFLSDRGALFTEAPLLLAAGALLLVAGIALWASASSSLRKASARRAVATDGPFRCIRHPIYASIYVLCIGMGLIFFAWTWFLVLAAFLPLWYIEAREEERDMIEAFGDQYVEYQRRTGMFFPRLRA